MVCLRTYERKDAHEHLQASQMLAHSRLHVPNGKIVDQENHEGNEMRYISKPPYHRPKWEVVTDMLYWILIGKQSSQHLPVHNSLEANHCAKGRRECSNLNEVLINIRQL